MFLPPVTLNLKFPGQNSTQGIGFGNFNPNPTAAERRKLITAKAFSFSEQKRLNHSLSLKRQGIWLKWSENSLPFDFSWKNLIWSSNYHIVKFVLHASINWVKTPELLNLWGIQTQVLVACVKLRSALYITSFRIAQWH